MNIQWKIAQCYEKKSKKFKLIEKKRNQRTKMIKKIGLR